MCFQPLLLNLTSCIQSYQLHLTIRPKLNRTLTTMIKYVQTLLKDLEPTWVARGEKQRTKRENNNE